MGAGASTQKAEGAFPEQGPFGAQFTEPEYLALEAEACKTGKTVADSTRDGLLRQLQACLNIESDFLLIERR